MKGHLCILLQVAALASSATATKNFQTPSGSSYIKKEDLPVTGNEWVSLDRNIEFLAAENVPLSNFGFNPPRRNLDEDEVEQAREDNAQYRVQPFVEGVSDYDENQQAWRLLGFMIDCDDKYSDADDDEYGQGCSRYVLWAAVRTVPIIYIMIHSYDCAWIDLMSHMPLSFIIFSTLTWATKTEEKGNINTGIARMRNGIRRLAITTPMVLDRVAPRWIVIRKIRTFHSWDFSNTSRTTIGWNSCSSTRAIAFGTRTSTNSWMNLAKPGRRDAQCHPQQMRLEITFITTSNP
jgi:hypothetical protein